MNNKNHIIFLCLLFLAVLCTKGIWERVMKQLLLEKFRTKELLQPPSSVPYTWDHKFSFSISSLEWWKTSSQDIINLDLDIILPMDGRTYIASNPSVAFAIILWGLSLVGDGTEIHFICVCAHRSVCTPGLYFCFGLSETREIRTIENNIKNYLPICSSPLSFFFFFLYAQWGLL